MHSSISSSEYDSPIFAMQNAQTVTKNCLVLGENRQAYFVGGNI